MTIGERALAVEVARVSARLTWEAGGALGGVGVTVATPVAVIADGQRAVVPARGRGPAGLVARGLGRGRTVAPKDESKEDVMEVSTDKLGGVGTVIRAAARPDEVIAALTEAGNGRSVVAPISTTGCSTPSTGGRPTSS